LAHARLAELDDRVDDGALLLLERAVGFAEVGERLEVLIRDGGGGRREAVLEQAHPAHEEIREGVERAEEKVGRGGAGERPPYVLLPRDELRADLAEDEEDERERGDLGEQQEFWAPGRLVEPVG